MAIVEKRREVRTAAGKGSFQLQTYEDGIGTTVRETSDAPPEVKETSEQIGVATDTTTDTPGDTVTTRTSTGIGSTKTVVDDKGVTLEFSVRFHQRQPILRQ